MKRFTSTGILVVGAALVSQLAQAQFTANDLYVGFTSPTTTSDYYINLGPASALTGSFSVVDLSSDFNVGTFVSTFSLLSGGSITNVSMGVIGGEATFPASYDLFATALRSGGPGNPAVAGSDLSGVSVNSSTISTAVGTMTRLTDVFPAANGGAVDTNNLWTANIAPLVPTAETFSGQTGINPDSTFDSSGILYEDLWQAPTGDGPYDYLGYFTMNPGDSSLTFTPAAVPEPTTTSIFTGCAFLLWCLRWRLAGKRV